MNDIQSFFIEIKQLGGAIWADQGIIKVFLARKFQTEERREFIVRNETNILSILNDNQITSKDDFKDVTIFKHFKAKKYPLSSAQERLRFIEQYEGGTNAYHIPTVFELTENTNADGLQYAIQQIVSRHETLRSTISIDGDQQGIQIVHNDPLVIEEVRTAIGDYENLLSEDINRPFDLSSSYPIRVKFYFVSSDASPSSIERTFLLINIHHIACDGWSMDIFQKELIAYYEAYCKKDVGFSLPALPIQYKDYALWQRSYLTGEVLNSQLSYWKNKLLDYQVLEFPADYSRPRTINYRGAQQTFQVSRETSIKLRKLARDSGATLHSVLLSSVAILLSKYTGQHDIVIGSPVANRHYRQTEGLIGFFVNMLVNRILLSSDQSFTDLVHLVHKEQIAAQLNQDLPFEKLVDELGVERDTSRHPIFQVMFVVQNFGNNTQLQQHFTPFTGSISHEVERFDLSVFISDDQDELSGRISYATSLFHADTIARLITHYHQLLELLCGYPERSYSVLSLLNSQEYHQIINEWNNTEADFPKDQTIHRIFERNAKKTPDNIALISKDKAITYSQLNTKSNQLARYISDQYRKRTGHTIKKDTLFVLYLERGPEIITAMLAVLKAGGAYVPIDTNFPQARINYILEDAQSEFVLCNGQTYGNTKIPDSKVLLIDEAESFEIADTSDLPLPNSSTDLAYVIYTSGTTGKPKGVMIDHRAVLSLVFNDYIAVSKNDVFAFLSSPVFDAATFEIWTALLQGNTLVVPANLKDLMSDVKSFRRFLTTHRITILWLTKTLFENLYFLDQALFRGIKCLIVGGEALDKIIVTEFVKSNSAPQYFLNGYGPTESTTFTCTFDLNLPITTRNVPIGVPIKNRSVYVLSPDLAPVPIGVSGELYIGGYGLSRGYLNDHELTAERFIDNPFISSVDPENAERRLYKTGDIVRWLPAGTLEYIGRNDDQIKIRGYRVELKEVETALIRIDGVAQSAVIMKERAAETGSLKYLVGYYVLDKKFSRKEADVLDSWENLYDVEYEKNVRQENLHADFSGWNSYISGQQIPISEMYEWRNSILTIIKGLQPKRVLEVGVGSGLLMYPLLEDVEIYTGVDLSQSIIDRHQANFKKKNFNVEFYHLRADQIDQLDSEVLYDTIIINSVCQYFPGIAYFESAIAKAIAKLSVGGSIFLGDIRNYDLHRSLIQDRLTFRKQAWKPSTIDDIFSRESELLISPKYFFQLSEKQNHLDVRVIERGKSFDNELSKYRYDVVISLKARSGSFSGSSFGIDSGNLCNIPFLNKLSKADIRDRLSEMIPDYMVPGMLIPLESMPLTINGKLDRSALPEVDFTVPSDGYVAPETKEETNVCLIWQQVLGVDKVGVNDDFFKIGGNSILAIRLSHRMTGLLGYYVRVSDIFTHKNIAQLLIHKAKHTLIGIAKTGSRQSVLSFAQERLWFIEQYEGGTNAYHIPTVFELTENTNADGLQYAIQQIVSRHETLRSTISIDGDQQGIQIVHNDPLVIEEVRTAIGDYENLLSEDINRPFDLSSSYPIRVKFYFVSSDASPSSIERTFLLINIHHIACDGWSMDIFQKELIAYYEAYCKKDVGFSLPALPIQYKDYALWQRSYLTGEVLNSQLSYWKNKLLDYQVLEFPADYSRPRTINYRGAQQTFQVSRETSIKLRKLARDSGATLHSVLLSSVAILLSKYTGQHDIVIGSPVANRHYRQTEGLIGFFVNMLVNRILLSSDQSFTDLVHLVHKEQIAAQLNQDLPFEKLVDELGVERDTSRHPIFQVMFVVQNFDNELMGSTSTKYIKPVGESGIYEIEKFDLSIFIGDDRDELYGRISYATSLFHQGTIAGLLEHYQFLLDQLADVPGVSYSSVGLLSDRERHQIIIDWNNTDRHYPLEKTVHQLFVEQAEKTPGNTALIFQDQELTYRELNDLSDRLACFIRREYKRRNNCEMSPGTLIGMFLDRGLEMVIGILSILKAGGAYVPIDISFPQERVDYILQDSDVALVVTLQTTVKDRNISISSDKVIDIQLGQRLYQDEKTSDLTSTSSSADLVYVLYTSGTTGRPKGVMLEHFSVCNRILYMIEYSKVSANDFHLFKTNYVFDVSFGEIFTHLCVGATIEISRDLFDITELNSLLTRKKFTSIHLVPSQYDLLAETIRTIELTKIYFSGEALTENIVSGLIDRPMDIYNYYGPTELGEITVSTVKSPNTANVIGKIFPNSRHYVLDANRLPVPVGVVGELYVGGVGVARGYLNQPELTGERFVHNFFATEEDLAKGYKVLYKTGDLVRWHSNCNLQYIGRKDEQAKIRGYRIELSEIAHVLMQVPGIKNACVLVKDRQTPGGSMKYLIAYYVSDNNLSQAAVSEGISRQLPNYMIPDYFVQLTSIPLTVNGKLDRRSLPEVDFGSQGEHVGPTTEIEKMLCEIWQNELRRDVVGITDEFFRIGGNSIHTIIIIARIKKIWKVDISVKDLFLNTTIQKTARLIQQKVRDIAHENKPPLARADKDGSADKRLYDAVKNQLWRHMNFVKGVRYSSNSMIKRELINVDRLAMSKALDSLVERHESLRTVFVRKEDAVFQRICPADEFTPHLQFFDLTESNTKSEELQLLINNTSNHLFDFENEPSFKSLLVKLDRVNFTFIFVIDHMIHDAHSLNLIASEIFILYEAYRKGEANPLTALKLQLRDYALFEKSHYENPKLAFHKSFFDELFRNAPRTPRINVIRNGYSERDFQSSLGGTYRFYISEELTRKIEKVSATVNISIFNFVLAAYCTFLSKVSDQNDFLVDTPMSTRTNEDFSKIIGWLTGTLVSRVRVDETKSFKELLLSCKKQIIDSTDHIYYQGYSNHVDGEWNLLATQLNVVFDNTSVESTTGLVRERHNVDKLYFDISFIVVVFSDGIMVDCNYNYQAINPSEISGICKEFVNVIQEAVNSIE